MNNSLRKPLSMPYKDLIPQAVEKFSDTRHALLTRLAPTRRSPWAYLYQVAALETQVIAIGSLMAVNGSIRPRPVGKVRYSRARDKVLSLMTSSPKEDWTPEELAETLELSIGTTYGLTLRLAAARILSRRTDEPNGPGRPRIRYRLTEEGQAAALEELKVPRPAKTDRTGGVPRLLPGVLGANTTADARSMPSAASHGSG